MAQKPSIPKGTRDFGPSEMAKREYIFDTVKSVFKLYGYSPIETPAMENLSSLLGKYGEEGDRLLFKVLNSGDAFAGVDPQMLQNSNSLSLKVCEKGLRYDLTVPFARFVVQHQNEITFPFKRYQIQPVWRADRPQKGRYREFFQCDADVVGSNSLLNEVELTAIYATVFERLQLPVEIRINSRKILAGLAELCGGQELMVPITVAIDKLDKIGIEKVKEELLQRGINQDQILIIEKYLSIDGANDAKIEQLKQLMGNNPTAIKGIEELEYILAYHSTKYSSKIVVDFTLARGLNYYTGVIFEIKAIGAQMGSIGGGGRYDDLTGLFGVPNVPGVGISFGVDRIYDV